MFILVNTESKPSMHLDFISYLFAGGKSQHSMNKKYAAKLFIHLFTANVNDLAAEIRFDHVHIVSDYNQIILRNKTANFLKLNFWFV